MKELRELVSQGLTKNHTIILSCNCSITYSGRAESHLDYGDRIIIIKADNTIIIHQPTGNNPVNYMKPGSHITINTKKATPRIEATHQKLKETMHITIKQLHFSKTQHLEDDTTITLEGTEKDMANHIYNQPSLIEEGFTPVNQEEQTTYGYIDVLGTDKQGNLCVIECKRYTADFKAVDQLRRYVERIKQSKGIQTVRGILASPNITPNAQKMIQDLGYNHVSIQPPKRQEKYNQPQQKLSEHFN